MTTIQKLYNIYFTNYPICIYNEANRCGNMAFAGIGLGLLQAQRMFWTANISAGVYIYNMNNKEMIYYNMFFYTLCIFLYTASLIKVANLIIYINISL